MDMDLADVLEDVQLAVYRSLAATGRLPTADHLAEVAGSQVRAAAAIVELAGQRAWALGDTGEIELAHPFATRSFGYSVMSAKRCGGVVAAGMRLPSRTSSRTAGRWSSRGCAVVRSFVVVARRHNCTAGWSRTRALSDADESDVMT